MKKITYEQALARAYCYEEAASHLEGNWTDDHTEMLESIPIVERLIKQSTEWFVRAYWIKQESK